LPVVSSHECSAAVWEKALRQPPGRAGTAAHIALPPPATGHGACVPARRNHGRRLDTPVAMQHGVLVKLEAGVQSDVTPCIFHRRQPIRRLVFRETRRWEPVCFPAPRETSRSRSRIVKARRRRQSRDRCAVCCVLWAVCCVHPLIDPERFAAGSRGINTAMATTTGICILAILHGKRGCFA
jgi:hypothetical protein